MNKPLGVRRLLTSAALASLIFTNAQAQSSADGPVITVSGGQVQGRYDSPAGGAVFKGIPFAAPPVGQLRWREPQAVKAWKGVRQAADYGPACMQVITDWNRAYATTASEDCLYLNVFTPALPAKGKKLPVMMWIYGGGNWGGSAIGNTVNEPPFDGAGLTPHGVVLVTINYRVGPFGFIGHPELTAESPHHASGNYGLLDQIAALKWIHANIARFGGDPGNVTIFGQSAGAVNSSYLIASPLTRGLVHRAILESGNPMVGYQLPPSLSKLEQQGVMLGQVLNAPSLKALRQVPAAAIIAAMPEFHKRLMGYAIADVPTAVGVDGYSITEFTPQTYRDGKEAPVPMMIGTTGHEGGFSLFQSLFGNGIIQGPPDKVNDAVKHVVEAFYTGYPDLTQSALHLYGVDGSGNEVKADPLFGPVQVQLGTDLAMRCPSIAIAGWHSAVAPVYHFEFTRGNAEHPPVHTAELKYVFGHLASWDAAQTGQQFATQVQDYWTNFARTGDPNGSGLPQWPKYQATSRESMDLGNEGPVVRSNVRAEACDLYTQKLKRDIAARKDK
jgi:para-nitrobenzyl esterase